MVVMGNPPYAVSSSNKGEWIQNLIGDYKILCENLEDGIELADNAEDPDTTDLFTRILHDANKNAWMLKATAKSMSAFVY